jgi:hypothetical protein
MRYEVVNWIRLSWGGIHGQTFVNAATKFQIPERLEIS